jgi:hypothetical protein
VLGADVIVERDTRMLEPLAPDLRRWRWRPTRYRLGTLTTTRMAPGGIWHVRDTAP